MWEVYGVAVVTVYGSGQRSLQSTAEQNVKEVKWKAM